MADLLNDLEAAIRLVESTPPRWERDPVVLPREFAERAVAEGWLHPSQVIAAPAVPAPRPAPVFIYAHHYLTAAEWARDNRLPPTTWRFVDYPSIRMRGYRGGIAVDLGPGPRRDFAEFLDVAAAQQMAVIHPGTGRRRVDTARTVDRHTDDSAW